MKPVVDVEHLSKLFRLGDIGATSLRESVNHWLARKKHSPPPALTASAATDRMGPEPNTFWGLRDVSFQVQPGEVIGIVGKNGAGKSTLLKILSRITRPTTGRAILRGRVVSLLEVGTGFHPELTGRENIFLNGTILGMTRREISSRFDEIVEFSEVGPFLDTPVKRYSSGMFVRLAFAVAAHLEPEILLIDEVLAVGDAAFQKKCLGKMGEVATKEGRTVFFVSHNMGAVRSLCETALLIEDGRLVQNGTSAEVISRYLSGGGEPDQSTGQIEWPDPTSAPSSEELRLNSIRLLNEEGLPQSTFEPGAPVAVEVSYEVIKRLRGARFCLTLLTQEGEVAFMATDHLFQSDVQKPGCYRTTCHIPGGLLNCRGYTVALQCDIPGERYVLNRNEYLSFVVSGPGNQASLFPEPWPGVVCPRIDWQVETLSSPKLK